jgi:hypothetical protein
MASLLLFLAASGLALGYFLYGLAIRRGLLEPSRASWLIWSAATLTEAATYSAVNHNAPQNFIFLFASGACMLVTIAVWRRSTWERPSILDSVSMAACTASIIVWTGFHHAWWGHVIMVVAIPISFLPTVISAYTNKTHEDSPAWGFWVIGDSAILLYVLLTTNGFSSELPYVIVELVCHATIWLMIGIKTINPRRTFRVVRGRPFVRIADESCGSQFLVGRNHLGKAIYAGQVFPPSHQMAKFDGEIFTKRSIPKVLEGAGDRFMQIGHDRFIGPSGKVDDLFNHSCAPNAGIKFFGADAYLVAIQRIGIGEEISWDYSTTILNDDWSMTCACRAAQCRGTVGDFQHLPHETQLRYRALNILPSYVAETVQNVAKSDLSAVIHQQ